VTDRDRLNTAVEEAGGRGLLHNAEWTSSGGVQIEVVRPGGKVTSVFEWGPDGLDGARSFVEGLSLGHDLALEKVAKGR
jgi:hypothetical protein